MKISITVKPSAKTESVERIDDANFRVAVKEPPIQGRANTAVIRALADFLNISPSRLQIISGYTSRQKIITIL